MNIDIETVDPSTGFDVCIYLRETRRKRASWIMWISPDGSAQLYTRREESGAIVGDPIKLGPSLARAARKKAAIGKK